MISRRRWLTMMTVLVVILLSCSFLGVPKKATADQGLRASYHGVACFAIDSDPRGAHVYGPDGSYWGKTSDSEYVLKEYHCGYPIDGKEIPCTDFTETLTAKKSAHKSTVHRFAVRYKRQDTCYAADWQKLVVVLDPAN